MQIDIKKYFSLCAIMALAVTCNVTLAKQRPNVEVSPFTDNVNVNLSNFSSSDTLTINYKNNNDVNISGPKSVSGTEKTFKFQIKSNNSIEDGYPSMTISIPDKDINCTLSFVDGPYTYLGYQSASPPTCDNITVSQINSDQQYLYHINISYKPN